MTKYRWNFFLIIIIIQHLWLGLNYPVIIRREPIHTLINVYINTNKVFSMLWFVQTRFVLMDYFKSYLEYIHGLFIEKPQS